MATKRIIVVEDERDMADLIAMQLQGEGYHVEIAGDGPQSLEALEKGPCDLMLLDLMLPQVSGLEVLREVRKNPQTRPLPVIIITAKSAEADVVAGFELGADDYVTKPFSLSVLSARVAAVMRRSMDVPHGAMTLGLVHVDSDKHNAQVSGQDLTLTKTEFRLLSALMAAGGRVLTRTQLVGQTIGLDAVVTERTIDVHLTALRRKLGGARDYIKTVRGVGYRMVAEEDETA